MLDIRWPIGLMFSLVGALLLVTGILSSPEAYQRSLGININLWWGLVLLLFGATMLFFAWRGGSRSETSASPPQAHR